MNETPTATRTTTATDLTVANTIAQQIGGQAFLLMGTKYKVGDSRALRFNLKGSKFCNWIEITLNGSDLYDIEFIKMANRGLSHRIVETVEDVYFDSLHEVIERRTGLYLSLRPRR